MIRIFTLLTAAVTVFTAGPAAHNELDLNNLAQRIGRQVDSASALLSDGMLDNAQALLRNAADDWNKYVESHNYLADREFARIAKLDTLVAECSAGFETALTGDLAKELPALKERLKFLFIAADLPILADFSGNSCKNCKIMKTRLTNISPEYQGKVRIVYVNVNVERDLIKLYRITLIPTLVFIGRDGKESSRFVGAMEENDLKKKLNDLYSK